MTTIHPIAETISPLASQDAVPSGLLHRIMNRREFLKETALGVAATTIALSYGYLGTEISDKVEAIGKAENERWPENDPSFTFLDNEPYRGQKEVAIYLPGFGDTHTEAGARSWKSTSGLSNDILTGFIDYSNQGTTIDGIAEMIKQKIDPDATTSLTFVCRSIGGLYVLPVAAKLGIPVKSLLLISSPSRLANGDFGNLGSIVGGLPQNRGIATLAKFGINAWRKHSDMDMDMDMASSLARGWHTTMSGASPNALQTELKTAKSIDINDPELLRQLESGVFIPGYTQIAYAATQDPETDQTVQVVASGNEFKDVFSRLQIDMSLVGVPYRGHAKVQETSSYLEAWTRQTTSPARTLASK